MMLIPARGGFTVFRIVASILALSVFGGVADAQPRGLPLSPGVRPGSPIGPGTQFLPMPQPRFKPPHRGFHGGHGKFGPIFAPGFIAPGFYPYPGFGYGYGGFPPYGYGYGYDYYPPTIPEPAPGLPLPRMEPGVALANEFPATLTLQFPGDAEVWLNGRRTEGKGEEHVLTSPVLAPGQTFTFDVKARWKSGGKTYETSRGVTLKPGDRSRLLVVSGEQVKE
jgi:uncharacterized protein (TIGR03000 family)